MSILILDDERTVRKALSFALQKMGYKIIEAKNAVEALELITINSFDLIVLDLNLPVISGFDFLDKMKEIGKNIPALVLTSQTKIKNKKNINFISKELPLSSIIKKIEHELNQT